MKKLTRAQLQAGRELLGLPIAKQMTRHDGTFGSVCFESRSKRGVDQTPTEAVSVWRFDDNTLRVVAGVANEYCEVYTEVVTPLDDLFLEVAARLLSDARRKAMA